MVGPSVWRRPLGAARLGVGHRQRHHRRALSSCRAFACSASSAWQRSCHRSHPMAMPNVFSAVVAHSFGLGAPERRGQPRCGWSMRTWQRPSGSKAESRRPHGATRCRWEGSTKRARARTRARGRARRMRSWPSRRANERGKPGAFANAMRLPLPSRTVAKPPTAGVAAAVPASGPTTVATSAGPTCVRLIRPGKNYVCVVRSLFWHGGLRHGFAEGEPEGGGQK